MKTKISFKKEKLIAMLLVVLMLLTVFMPFGYVKAEDEEVPDINSNYSITAGDKAGQSIYNQKLGDVNGDGVVTGRDANLLMKHLAHVNGIQIVESNLDIDGDENTDELGDVIRLKQFITGVRTIQNIGNSFYRANEYLIGQTFPLKLINNETNEYASNVTWSSSDTSVATIDSSTGLLSIVGKGTATITATTQDNQVDSFVLHGIENVDTREHGSVIIEKDNFQRTVDLTIEDSLKGIEVEMLINRMIQGTEEIPTVTAKTDGWQITQTNYKDGRLKFIAEVTDEALNNNQELDDSVKVEIKIPDEVLDGKNCTEVIVTNVAVTDGTESNTRFPLSGYTGQEALIEVDGNFGVVLTYTDPVRVKAGCEDKLVFTQNTWFAKLDEDECSWDGLLNCMEFRSGYEIKRDNTEIPLLGWNGPLVISNNEEGLSINVWYLCVIGNVCRDNNYTVDINDVIYLRKAIVGLFNNEEGYPSNFDIDASYTSLNYRDELNLLGNIGDVIAIRKRILNTEWNAEV